MMGRMSKHPRPPGWLALLSACGLFLPCLALAQSAANVVPSMSSSSTGEEGVSWGALHASHRMSLAPLEDQWASLSATTKDKWIRVARRMATMKTTERERIQGRMADWARLTPVQRGQARLYFQESRNVAPEIRAEQWKRYNELSDDDKRQLTARAVPPAATRSVSGARGAGSTFSVNTGQPATKINTTPIFAAVPLPQRIAPSVVQVQPGATTTLISSRPKPPVHQPAGMPKIGTAFTTPVAEPRAVSQPLSPSTDFPAQP